MTSTSLLFCFAFSRRALAFTRIDILFFFSASDERVSASSHSCYTKTSSFCFLVFESFRSASISFLFFWAMYSVSVFFIQVDLEPTPCMSARIKDQRVDCKFMYTTLSLFDSIINLSICHTSFFFHISCRYILVDRESTLYV